MGGKIGFIFILVVIIGVGLFLYNSGLIQKSAQGLSSILAVHTNTSTSPANPFPESAVQGPTTPETTIFAPPESNGSSGAITPSDNVINPADIPPGFTASQLSPYFKEVTLGGVSSGNSYYYGQITLNTSLDQGETVDVTGWEIKSLRGGEYVPQAIAIYDPSGLTPPSDIRVKSGDTVNLYSSSAPFNLRINKCIGYIAHVANFNPGLPGNCPSVDQSQIRYFTGACQNYINSIGSCSQPDLSDPSIPQTDYSCRDFIANNFNYKSCFNQHESDPDFLSNEVWVWTGSDILDPYHDQVELLDRNGLLVDITSY